MVCRHTARHKAIYHADMKECQVVDVEVVTVALKQSKSASDVSVE